MVNMPATQLSYFPLKGGLNLVTPPLAMPDGMCREAQNFEASIDGGYRRIDGYERFSGQFQPSDAVYKSIGCEITGEILTKNIITGETSGATAYVIGIGDAILYVTKVLGTFVEGEELSVLGDVQGIATTEMISGFVTSPLLDVTFKYLASNAYREDIDAVPGSGSILGVHRYKNVVYAFRNNEAGTAAVMYKSTSSGWVAVDLGISIAFSNANAAVENSTTLTLGGVSSAINRVVLESGSFASGVNTGRIIISAPSGGSFTAGAATSDGGGTLTLGGAESAITLAPDGRYTCLNYNFTGSSSTMRMYGASGTHEAFEFDGSVYVPLVTGLPDDRPKHIIIHNNYLFLSFESSVIVSGVSNPYTFTVIAGAGEIATGDDVTGFLSLVGSNASGALAIFTRNKTLILYGSTAADFNLVTYSYESGGAPYTMQKLTEGYVFDSLGLRQLAASQDFGNFIGNQVTKNIRPFTATRVNKANGSCIVRTSNQYRLLFNDKFALYITFDNAEVVGIMPIKYAHSMTCMASFENDDGEDFVYCGDVDGFVYRMNRGTSFDGEKIDAFISLNFAHMGNPRSRKRYRKAAYEISGNNYAEFLTGYDLGYTSEEINQGNLQNDSKNGGAFYWDQFFWDAFYWDGRSITLTEQSLTGTAENISLAIKSESAYFEAFTVNAVIIHYTTRRQLR